MEPGTIGVIGAGVIGAGVMGSGLVMDLLTHNIKTIL